jgi:hypothetical protein
MRTHVHAYLGKEVTMNKKILRTKENEIAKAGKLVFDAIFGDDKELEQRLSKELDEETDPPADPSAIDVQGYTVVRCARCPREAVLPANVDARALEQVGWRRVAGSDAWCCPMCASAPKGSR